MPKLLTKVLLACAICLPVAGCRNTNVAPPPPLVDQVNDFDGNTYRALVTLKASLDSLRADIVAKPELVSLKPSVNQAGKSYNLAMVAWKTYHAAATVANQQAAQAALAKAQSDVTTLSSAVAK